MSLDKFPSKKQKTFNVRVVTPIFRGAKNRAVEH